MKKSSTPLSFLTAQTVGKQMLAFSFPALSRPFSFFTLVAVISCTLLTISSTTVSAQANAWDPVSAPITTDALPSAGWKAPADYATVLSTERANTAVVLASPNLKNTEFALYSGYDRMLSYMQLDLAAGAPIEEIAINNYKRVLQEAPADPVLGNMHEQELGTLYDALIVKLVSQ